MSRAVNSGTIGHRFAISIHMSLATHVAPFCRAALAVCTISLVACVSTSRDRTSDRLALVIGNAAYENAPALTNPVNDATDMCAALAKVGFTTLCHTNLRDRAEFEARVKDYVDRLTPNMVGVVYYSGHGVQARSENFLIPTQVQPRTVAEDPRRVLYSLDALFDSLRQKPTKFQFVILDACRTDLFPRSPPVAGGRGADVAARSILLRALENVGRASNGLAPIKDAPSATKVFYATASNDTAFDGKGRNGPLTKHILKHIGTPGLLVDLFIQKVTAGVETETEHDYGKRMTPFTYGSFTGQFCFAGCPLVLDPVPSMN